MKQYTVDYGAINRNLEEVASINGVKIQALTKEGAKRTAIALCKDQFPENLNWVGHWVKVK